MQPRAILFDLDGTLIDTYRLYVECYQRALEPHLGYAPTEQEIAARRPSSERRFLDAWVGPERGARTHARVQELYAERFAHACEGPYDGVPEMLAALRTAGYPLGIVTGKSRAAWEVTRTHLDLGGFGVVVTDDDMPAAKPDPAGLLLAAEGLGIVPAHVVYIGDGTADLQAGRGAGMQTGAALWPKTAPGEVERFIDAIAALAPEWSFAHPGEVTRAFAAWC